MELKDLPLIEQRAIKMLLGGGGDAQAALRHQLEAVKAVQRSESSAGVYAIFELDDDVLVLDGKPSFHLADVFAKSGKCEEIGFILFINHGVIDYLEGYSYGDIYPPYDGCDYTLYRQESGGLLAQRDASPP